MDTGIGGRKGTRNSGTILDAAYMDFQFWDGRAKTLEEQALGPIHNPVEMGEQLDNVVRKLSAIDDYRTQFKAVFGTDVTADGIAKAIAAFERTVLSGPSPYDRFMTGDKTSVSESAVRGMRLFDGKAGCHTCHQPPLFSDQSFHNIGVGMDWPQPDVGRQAVTKNPLDRGKFKTPSLRNVALTWPYFHDGSAATLGDVVEFYDRAGCRTRLSMCTSSRSGSVTKSKRISWHSSRHSLARRRISTGRCCRSRRASMLPHPTGVDRCGDG